MKHRAELLPSGAAAAGLLLRRWPILEPRGDLLFRPCADPRSEEASGREAVCFLQACELRPAINDAARFKLIETEESWNGHLAGSLMRGRLRESQTHPGRGLGRPVLGTFGGAWSSAERAWPPCLSGSRKVASRPVDYCVS